MTAIANEITCDIKRTFVKESADVFIFKSRVAEHYGSAFEEEKLL